MYVVCVVILTFKHLWVGGGGMQPCRNGTFASSQAMTLFPNTWKNLLVLNQHEEVNGLCRNANLLQMQLLHRACLYTLQR